MKWPAGRRIMVFAPLESRVGTWRWEVIVELKHGPAEVVSDRF